MPRVEILVQYTPDRLPTHTVLDVTEDEGAAYASMCAYRRACEHAYWKARDEANEYAGHLMKKYGVIKGPDA